MPAIDWTPPPVPPPAERPAWTTDPSGPRRRMRLAARAVGFSLAAAAVGTGALAADLTSHATTTTTSSGTVSTGTTSTAGTSTAFAQAVAPGSSSGSSAVHASTGGS